MTPSEKQAYLRRAWPQYQCVGRNKKQEILDEFCANCGYSRKYAIELLNKPIHGGRKGKKPGRRSKYGALVF